LRPEEPPADDTPVPFFLVIVIWVVHGGIIGRKGNEVRRLFLPPPNQIKGESEYVQKYLGRNQGQESDWYMVTD
jgi:hypothetical protein